MSTNPDANNPNAWNLYEFIQVTEKLAIIKTNTAKQAGLAKDSEISSIPVSLNDSAKNATALLLFLR